MLNTSRTRKRMIALGLAAVTTLSLMAVASPAPAALVNARIVAGPAAFLPNVQYLTPVAVMARGGNAVFTNLDIALHDVFINRTIKTPKIGFGQSASVSAAKTLPRGRFVFKCTLHPWMRGTLVVV